MRKFLITGIPPYSSGGTVQLLQYLHPFSENYEIVCEKEWSYNLGHRHLPQNIIAKFKDAHNVIYNQQLDGIRDSEIILFHPQTIGFDIFLKLIENNKIVKIYILDNSFFCIKSYNYKRSSDLNECLDCLNNLDNCHAECVPFPIKYNKADNIKYLKRFKELSNKIIFYVQNEKNAVLLKKHFGNNTKYKIVGMKTNEFDNIYNENLNIGNKVEHPDIVYHGWHKAAKGVLYVLELAKYLKDYSFLIPCNKGAVINNYGKIDIPNNVEFKHITWETGLKENVINCKLVLCPSLWTATIEGALVKSILYNGNVAVYNTKYGFQSEFPENCLLRLNDDYDDSSNKIKHFIKNNHTYSIKSKEWIIKYLNEFDPKIIFNDVNMNTAELKENNSISNKIDIYQSCERNFKIIKELLDITEKEINSLSHRIVRKVKNICKKMLKSESLIKKIILYFYKSKK